MPVLNNLNFNATEAWIKKVRDTNPELYNALDAMFSNIKGIAAFLSQEEAALNRRTVPSRLESLVRPAQTLPPPLAQPGEGLTFFDKNRKRFRKSFDTYEYYDYPTPEGCRVYNDADEVIATATVTALTFNTERFDPFAMHSVSTNTNRITIPISGRYVLGAHIDWDTNTTGIRLGEIRLNGATVIHYEVKSAAAGGTFGTTTNLATMYEFAKDDYIEVLVYQDSGANRNVVALPNLSPEFFCHRVG